MGSQDAETGAGVGKAQPGIKTQGHSSLLPIHSAQSTPEEFCLEDDYLGAKESVSWEITCCVESDKTHN